MQAAISSITGVVLAGGRARRMGGGDKGLVLFRGSPLVSYAVDALRQIAGRIVISANRNEVEYARFGLPVVSDATGTFDGPLAGVLSAMKASDTAYLMAVPCDSPMMTGALLARLVETLTASKAEVCVAHDGERMHPVFLLAETALMSSLEQFLASGERKIDRWLVRHRLALADYSDHPELFVNVNTADELSALEARLDSEASARPEAL